MTISRILVSLFALFAAPLVSQANPDPKKGRYLQRDPNSTGVVVLNDTSWFHGRVPLISPDYLDVRSMYGDGMNLYEYLGSNPIVRSDPLGLSWDPFDMVDDIGQEHQMSGALAFAKLDSYFHDKQMLRAIRAYERGAFEWSDMVWDRDVGILFSMVGGTFFSKICFVEGTVIETSNGPIPIERLKLGEEVTSQPDPRGAEPERAMVFDNLILVRLRYSHPGGGSTTMEILRPASLIKALGVVSGGRLPVWLAELGVTGEAEVTAIEAYRNPIQPDVSVITGRFVTEGAEVVEVSLAGYEDPIGVTPLHSLFSADRGTWVPAGALLTGERLQSISGPIAVTGVVPRDQCATVYNVEVSRYHTYFVGEAAILAHNPCNEPFPFAKPGWKVGKFDQCEWIGRNVNAMLRAAKYNRAASPKIYEEVAQVLRKAREAEHI